MTDNNDWTTLNVGTGAGGSLGAPIPFGVLQADIRRDLVDVDVCCSLEYLPFKDDAFKHVYCIHTLEHLNNPVKGLKELIRVCYGVVEVEVPHRLGKQAKAPTHAAGFSCRWFTSCLRNFTYSLKTPWDFPRHINIHVWIYPHIKKGIKKRVLVLDLDETLFKVTKLSYFLFRLANKIFLLGFRVEKINKHIRQMAIDYDKTIILSGRANDWMKKATLKQLKKHQVKFDKIILCPRDVLYLEWKKKQIHELQVQYPDLVWVDDGI